VLRLEFREKLEIGLDLVPEALEHTRGQNPVRTLHAPLVQAERKQYA
jgi:hypothetical protein